MKRISPRRSANPLCASSGLVHSESTLFVISGHIKAFEYEAKSRCYAGGGAREGDEERQNIAGVAEEGSSGSSSSSSSSSSGGSGGGGGGIVFHCTAFNCIPKWLCAKSSPLYLPTTLAILLLQPGTDGEASSAP